MYHNKKILALIPARGGSKGIKNKNITPLAGKPLIAYTVEAAEQSKYIDKIVVSTDSDEIASVAREYGAEIPFMRPKELATDTSKTLDVVLHTIRVLKDEKASYDCLVLLQPTQPLRTAEDVDKAIEIFFQNNERALVSVSEVNDSPLLIRSVSETGELKKLLNVSSTCRRQDMPIYYRVNGCIYINKVSEICEDTSFNDNEIPYIMPRERSADIDDLADLALAEYYLGNNDKM